MMPVVIIGAMIGAMIGEKKKPSIKAELGVQLCFCN